LPLTQAAGAVLRENIYAERDQPPFDRVAMDGIALSRPARRQRRTPARRGTQAPAIRRRRSTIRDLHRDHDGRDAAARLRRGGAGRAGPAQRRHRRDRRKAVQPWQNVIGRGSDCPQGALLLAAGTRLSAPEGRDCGGRRHGPAARQRPTHDRRDLDGQ
jgi:molybdopterin molybdotransferase